MKRTDLNNLFKITCEICGSSNVVVEDHSTSASSCIKLKCKNEKCSNQTIINVK